MRQTLDTTLHFVGLHGFPSRCRLRVLEEDDQPPLVLVTELDENEGTSVTNAIEIISWQAYKLLERPEAGLRIVEHYRDRGKWGSRMLYKEQFDSVTFLPCHNGLRDPVWKPVQKHHLETLIGQTLED